MESLAGDRRTKVPALEVDYAIWSSLVVKQNDVMSAAFIFFFFFLIQYLRAGSKPMARLWAEPLLGLKRGLCEQLPKQRKTPV